MTECKYRNELKHYINTADCIELRSRLKHVAKLDSNARKDGSYVIRSLYFDNYEDKVVTDKLSGMSRREKFRLRYYNEDTSFIRLEKKSKINKGCYKQSEQITTEQCESILRSQFHNLLSAETPLISELYTKIRCQHLRPRLIVEYEREAYVFPAGNVRITIDSDIRSSGNVSEYLELSALTAPSASATILEVKYDSFLPDIIKDVLQLGCRHLTEFSKYVVSRHI